MLWVRTIRHIDQWSGKSILCYFLIFYSFPLNVSESWVSRTQRHSLCLPFSFFFFVRLNRFICLKTCNFLSFIDISIYIYIYLISRTQKIFLVFAIFLFILIFTFYFVRLFRNLWFRCFIDTYLYVRAVIVRNWTW